MEKFKSLEPSVSSNRCSIRITLARVKDLLLGGTIVVIEDAHSNALCGNQRFILSFTGVNCKKIAFV